jgi:hypothetical protein
MEMMMHNPSTGSFELYATEEEAKERQRRAAPPGDLKNWRIFSEGERVEVCGVPMIVAKISPLRLSLRPLTPKERRADKGDDDG